MLTIGRHSLAVVASVAILGAGTTARAQDEEKGVTFGVQGDWSDDADFGVGGRVIVNLDRYAKGLEAVGSFDYFFPSTGSDLPGVDIDVTYFEFNANAVYKFTLSKQSFRPYLGAGLNIAHSKGGVGIDLGELGSFDASGSDTKAGLNVLGGVLFGKGKRKFFVEAKAEAGGGELFVASAGVRF